MMQAIMNFLEKFDPASLLGVLSLIVSILFIFLGIIGKIQVKQMSINVSSKSQKIPLVVFGLIYLIIAFLVLLYSPKQEEPELLEAILLKEPFEWQWAGENWLGTATFEKTSEDNLEVEIAVSKHFTERDAAGNYSTQKTLVLENVPGEKGNVSIHSDYIEIKKLMVNKNTFQIGLADQVESSAVEILEARLKPVRAFAGKVTYKTTGGSGSDGDMILVQYRSSIP